MSTEPWKPCALITALISATDFSQGPYVCNLSVIHGVVAPNPGRTLQASADDSFDSFCLVDLAISQRQSDLTPARCYSQLQAGD